MGVHLPLTSKHKLLKDSSDILGGSVAREMSEGKIVDVVAGEVGPHDLEVQHAV